jgi:hypothetical protein
MFDLSYRPWVRIRFVLDGDEYPGPAESLSVREVRFLLPGAVYTPVPRLQPKQGIVVEHLLEIGSQVFE